ncbi:MAG: regulatory protein RecX [Thermodesulfovibrionales bacterium]
MRKKQSALSYSLKLLSYRGRSEGELIKRLSMKGYDDNEIKNAMRRLKEMGLIDDRSVAFNFRNYAEGTKRLGTIGIRNFLLTRGISAEIIDEVCHDIDEEGNALRLLEKRIKGYSDEGDKRRVYSLLQRKGYSFETIRKVLKKFYNEEVS